MVNTAGKMLLLFGLMAPVGMCHATDEFSLKATFLYRFAQYTQWPPPPRTVIRFCVAEHPQLLQALNTLPVEAQALTPDQPVDRCDVIMLGAAERIVLQHWQQQLAGRPLLIVTDNAEAYRQLAMIQLLTSPDGISFQVDLQRTHAHQLKLGSQLLKLARQVD